MDGAARRKAELDARMAARQKEAEERRANAKARAAAGEAQWGGARASTTRS